MPSAFGACNRTYSDKTDVVVVTEDKYFGRIREEIENVRRAQRAILVFFESEPKLTAFSTWLDSYIQEEHVQVIQEITPVADRDIFIKRAATLGKVTLLTRMFGRGTDFICSSQQLVLNGGVHVLQTFFSDELSEEYQIMGRGARQGDRGSYRMILLNEDLEWVVGTSWKEKLSGISHDTMYQTLNKARQIQYESKCGAKKISVAHSKEKHQRSIDFMNALIEGKSHDVKAFLIEQNRAANILTSASRTVILMDATGSMSTLLTAAKETVCEMFERACVVLAEQKIPSDAFQIQFAVYRNYNSRADKILQVSSWETKGSHLRRFMDTIRPEGGMGNEAIEIGLQHAVHESELSGSISQVILIGDAPANSEAEVRTKRAAFGEAYWKTTEFATSTFYEVELEKLDSKNIPVNAFYLEENARKNFEKISAATKGTCQSLNIRAGDGAEVLTHAVTKEVLRLAAGPHGGEAVKSYIDLYEKS